MTALFINILIAVLFPGTINRIRAWCSGRKGIPFFQNLRNVRLLMNKSAVYGDNTSVIFKIVPVAYFVVLLFALLFIPFGFFSSILSFKGDFIFFIYLLALSRFLMVLGALDTGSSFEGMGASREALYGVLMEPVLLIILGTTSLITGKTSFELVFDSLFYGGMEFKILGFLLLYAFIKIIVVEAGRIPFDDTRTHLELTMVHEVMILNYSGIDLAFITIGGWIKNATLIGVGSMVAFSVSGFNTGYYYFFPVFALIIMAYIGISESFMARNKLSRNPLYILILNSLVILIFFVAFMLTLDINFI